MGIWSPAAYDALLLEKTKILLGAALDNPRRRGGNTSYEQFVKDLDADDKSSRRVFEALLYQTTSRRPCPPRPSSAQLTSHPLSSHITATNAFDLSPPSPRHHNIDPSIIAEYEAALRLAPSASSGLATDQRGGLSRLEVARMIQAGPGDEDDSIDDADLPSSWRITREALFGTALPMVPGEAEARAARRRVLSERRAETEAQAAARRMMDVEESFADSSDEEDMSVSRRWGVPARRLAAGEVQEGIDQDDYADGDDDDEEFADSLGRIQDLPERVGTGGEGIWRARGVNADTIGDALAYEARDIERVNAARVAGARRTPAAFREELERAVDGMGREGFEGAFAGFARRRRAQARDAGSGEAPATTTGSTETNTPRSSTPSIAIDTPASSLGASPTASSLCPPSPHPTISATSTSAAIAEAAARERRVRPLPSRTGSNDDEILPLTALGSSLSGEERVEVLQRLYSLAAARAEGRREI